MDKKVLNNHGKFVPMSDDAKRDFTEHKIDLSEKKVDLRTKEEILKDSIGVLPVKFTQHHIELILSAMESYASLLTSEKDKRIEELERGLREMVKCYGSFTGNYPAINPIAKAIALLPPSPSVTNKIDEV